MERTPVRYAVLRDRRVWDREVEMPGLQPEPAGALTLARVPGLPDGQSQIVNAPPFNVELSGIVAAAHDDLYLADAKADAAIWLMGNCRARELTIGGGDGAGDLKSPRGLATCGGRLYLADSGNARIVVFHLATLEQRAVWEGLLQNPTCVACDSRDRVYVLDAGLKRVLRFDGGGAPDAAYNAAMSQHANLAGPLALAVGAGDTLFVADGPSAAVLVFDAEGHFTGTLPSASAPARPWALAAWGSRLYAADAASGWIHAHETVHGWLGILADYRGPVSAMTCDATGGLILKPDAGDRYVRLAADAAYVSSGEVIAGPFDAGDLCEWERVRVDLELPPGTAAELRIYTAAPSIADPTTPVDEPSATDWADPARLARSLDTLLPIHDAASGAPGIRGRFVWLRLRLSSADAHVSPRVHQIQAATTDTSYLDHLPAVYAREDTGFFARWLALFRSDLGDWHQALDEIARHFDASASPEEDLPRLAQWVAFALPDDKEPDEWRQLLLDAQRLYERRGTVFGFAELCELYTGVRPQVFEAFRDRRVWQLAHPASALGLDTALAPAQPDGLVVPGFTYADPAFMGLRGDYYSGTRFERLRLSRIDDVVDRDWQLGSPVPGVVESDRFSVRWTGQVQPRYTELYTFRTESDDGVRLWVNGRLLIDDWREHGRAANSGQIALTGGRWYPITLEYFDAVYTSSISLSWSSRSQVGEIVPKERLYALVDPGAALPEDGGGAAEPVLVGQAVVGGSGPFAAADLGLPVFTDTAHLFTVLVPAARFVTASKRQRLERIVRAETPAHTDVHLCFVDARMRVGVQARVGIDALLAGDPTPLSLGDAALGVDAVLGEHRDRAAEFRVDRQARIARGTVLT